jgi:hypothetical protein
VSRFSLLTEWETHRIAMTYALVATGCLCLFWLAWIDPRYGDMMIAALENAGADVDALHAEARRRDGKRSDEG